MTQQLTLKRNYNQHQSRERQYDIRAGQDIITCPGQVVLHAGQVDHPKYLPDRTSKLKHIENDCLFVIS